MPVRLLEALEKGCYVTDGKRLLRVVLFTEKEALCEDALTGVEEGMSMTELAKPRWRRVHQKKAA